MDFQDAPITAQPIDDGAGYRVAIFGGVHTNTAWIERELTQVATAAPKRVELDLSKCDFLSSSGIGVLMAFYNKLKAGGGGPIEITAIQKPVYGSLRLSRLDTLFTIKPEAIIAKA